MYPDYRDKPKHFLRSKTTEQRTCWGQHKFSCCVLCREVVLFSEVQNVLKGNQLFEKCPL